MHRVTAIIPTACVKERAESLTRAISSLHAASRDPITILLVINGNRFDSSLAAKLRSRTDIKVAQIPEGSAPLAQLHGRTLVDTEFFCFLDDDDEYLPGAIDGRIEALEREPTAALVATNGYRNTDGIDTLVFQQLQTVPHDPLFALFRENWLASCGGLFRSDDVGVEFFERPHQYLEWTWLAFRIGRSGKRIVILDQPSFRIFDTPSSVSKTSAYLRSHVALYRRMLQEPLPGRVSTEIRKRLVIALSMQSLASLQEEKLGAAWAYHLQALSMRGGWRYARQTLRLAGASIRRILAVALFSR